VTVFQLQQILWCSAAYVNVLLGCVLCKDTCTHVLPTFGGCEEEAKNKLRKVEKSLTKYVSYELLLTKTYANYGFHPF
jgi:hypothetical protein